MCDCESYDVIQHRVPLIEGALMFGTWRRRSQLLNVHVRGLCAGKGCDIDIGQKLFAEGIAKKKAVFDHIQCTGRIAHVWWDDWSCIDLCFSCYIRCTNLSIQGAEMLSIATATVHSLLWWYLVHRFVFAWLIFRTSTETVTVAVVVFCLLWTRLLFVFGLCLRWLCCWEFKPNGFNFKCNISVSFGFF